MRKSLILLLLLTVLSVGTVVLAHSRVNETADAVAIDETVLYGDKAMAEGIEIESRAVCADHMFWDVSYTVGENPAIRTVLTSRRRSGGCS
jgi:hypothetical protein